MPPGRPTGARCWRHASECHSSQQWRSGDWPALGHVCGRARLSGLATAKLIALALLTLVDWWLSDPSSSPGSCACGEPAGDAEPIHDGSDMPTDGGGADPGAAGDRVVVESFG